MNPCVKFTISNLSIYLMTFQTRKYTKQFPNESQEEHSQLNPKEKAVEGRSEKCLHCHNPTQSAGGHVRNYYANGNVDNKNKWTGANIPRILRNNFVLSDGGVIDYRTYFNISSQISKGNFSPETIPLDILPILPTISLRFKDEVYFTKNCLWNWWLALSQNLRNVERTTLAKALIGLSKMNQSTNGVVLDVIPWGHVQRLAIECLSGIGNKVSSRYTVA